MSADKKRLMQQLFMRGNEAMNKQNWGYAVEMFTNCVKLDPENQQVRVNLRLSQRKVHNDNGKGAKMSGMKLMGIRGKVKKAKAKENWDAMDALAEEGLAVNPWDAQLNFDVGQANEARGFLVIASLGYKWAIDADPQNKDYLRAMASVLESRASYNDAIMYWERIHKLDPMDSEARGKVTQLHAENMIDRGGYEDAEKTTDVKQKTGSAYDQFDPATQKKEEVVGPGESSEADIRRQIRKTPEEVPLYLKLAALLKEEKRLDETREVLQQALEASGGDANIREQMEDVELELLRNNFELANQAAKQNPEDEIAKENAQALLKEVVKREIQVMSARVERYPRDNKLKMELAKRLMRVRMYDKAIPHLQKASADQRYAAEVGVMLGQSFIGVNKASLAVNSLLRSVPLLNSHDQQALYCEANYLLGKLFESGGDREKAEKHYNDVISIDYEYKDSIQRLEKLQEG